MDFDSLTADQLRARGSQKWNRRGPEVLPMWIAEMDFPLAEPVTRAVDDVVRRQAFGYAEVDDRVPRAFAEFAGRRLGLEVNPAWTTVVPHVLHGIEWALDSLLPAGAGVVVTTPVYMHFMEIPGLTHRPCVDVPLLEDTTTDAVSQRWTLDLAGIERAFADGARGMILCQPHNPVGAVFSREQLAALAEIVDRFGGWVVSDEIHAPLTMPGVEHVAYASVSPKAASHCATVTSASKSFSMPGLSCATITMHTQAAHVAFLAGIHEDHLYGATTLGIEANVAAFTQGDEWLDGARAVIARNAHHAKEVLARELPQVGYLVPDATYFAWLDLRALDLGDDPAAWLIDNAKVWMNSGHAFGEAGRGYARMNLATTQTLLDEGLRRIVEAVRAR